MWLPCEGKLRAAIVIVVEDDDKSKYYCDCVVQCRFATSKKDKVELITTVSEVEECIRLYGER